MIPDPNFRASRSTPSNVNGMPVENSGSTNAAADGNSAQRSPDAHEARHASRGIQVNSRIGRAVANCAAIVG
jgi:hypothetical protein